MRFLVYLTVAASPLFAGDWDARRAADYLDERQKQWFEWKVAQRPGGPCLSCHTGLPYLLARPALRRQLGEAGPTPYETGLLQAVDARVAEWKPGAQASDGLGTDAVLGALVHVCRTPDRGTTQSAFGRMWALQISEGPKRGAWPWFSLELDPWEMPHSSFFGAALAAVAVGQASPSNLEGTRVRSAISQLAEYLEREQASQPIHHRVLLLWVSSNLVSPAVRAAILKDIWAVQSADGGWTRAAIGPWHDHPQAPAAEPGSDAYSTAWMSGVLSESGVASKDRRLRRALNWLRVRQDPVGGFWDSRSMNKVFQPGSMMEGFMRDAATGWAVLALSPKTVRRSAKIRLH